MLRSVTLIFLAFTILSTNFSRLFVYAGFELNQNFIAETLCVNKDQPKLGCKGKCFLKEKLKKAAEKEKKQEKEQKKQAFQEAFITNKNALNINQPLIATIATVAHAFNTVLRYTSIFQPPKI